MGYPTKVQLIRRQASAQWYVNFPAAVAQAMEFEKGEVVEWIVEAKDLLVLRRPAPPPSALEPKKKAPKTKASSAPSKASSSKPAGPSPRSGSSGAP